MSSRATDRADLVTDRSDISHRHPEPDPQMRKRRTSCPAPPIETVPSSPAQVTRLGYAHARAHSRARFISLRGRRPGGSSRGESRCVRRSRSGSHTAPPAPMSNSNFASFRSSPCNGSDASRVSVTVIDAASCERGKRQSSRSVSRCCHHRCRCSHPETLADTREGPGPGSRASRGRGPHRLAERTTLPARAVY